VTWYAALSQPTTPAARAGALFAGTADGYLHRLDSNPQLTPSGEAMPVGSLNGWHQVFSDDFTGDSIDSNKWGLYSNPPSSDPESRWSPSHITVANGMATIATYRDPRDGNLWTSGGMSDARAVHLSSGRYQIRMRADKAHGVTVVALLWPIAKVWPPEIDFVENRDGNRSGLAGTLHYAADGQNHQIVRTDTTDMTAWHTYGVSWHAGEVVYTLDGKTWATVKTPFVPQIPMALDIQSNADSTGQVRPDTSTPPYSGVQIDWVVGYARS
jgi:beta-glucanase (GH16 family)